MILHAFRAAVGPSALVSAAALAILLSACGSSDAGARASSDGGAGGAVNAGGACACAGNGSTGGLTGAGGEGSDSGSPPQSGCPPLPVTGTAIDLDPASDIVNAVRNATPGDTFLLADGTYPLGGQILQLLADGVTLRGKSGDRETVILDGEQSSSSGEVIAVTGSDVTIAHLTVANAYTHAIHVQTTDAKDTLRTLIYDVHVKDALEQAIKINLNAAETHYPDQGVIACSHIELTNTGRPSVRNNCYTGGIDAHGAQGWTIRDNVIEGFYCASGLSEHGVHFWTGSRDTVVERNRIGNCARGVGFGLGETTASSTDTWRTYADNPCGSASPVGHYGGIIRNNFVFANDPALFSSASGFDSGIAFEQACGSAAIHNTIYGTTTPLSSAIEWRFASTSITATNNLANAAFEDRGSGAIANASGNIDTAAPTDFVDAARGDLHLSSSPSGIIGAGVSVAGGTCDDDIDGEVRPSARDVGADQRNP